MGSSEITFICGGKRVILTVTYKGGGGGSILFHQASWDPVFLADINPEDSVDLDQLLSGKVRAVGAVLLCCMQSLYRSCPSPRQLCRVTSPGCMLLQASRSCIHRLYVKMRFLPLSVYKSSSAEARASVAVRNPGLASQRRYHRHCMDNAVPEG